MKRFVLGILSVAGLGLVAAACGATTPERGCADMYAAICSKFFDCPGTTPPWEDETTCADRLSYGCRDLVALPGTKFTGGGFEACALSVRAAPCAEIGAALALCEPALRGERIGGSACAVGAQCVSGVCDGAGSGKCGTCAALSGQGERCGDGYACDSDYFCSPKTNHCRLRITQGLACDADSPCDVNIGCIDGTCQPYKSNGATCTLSGDCQSASCVIGECVAPTPPLEGAQARASCGAFGTEVVHCAGGLYCDVEKLGGRGTCRIMVADGGSCADSVADPCTPPATCTKGTCRLPAIPQCD